MQHGMFRIFSTLHAWLYGLCTLKLIETRQKCLKMQTFIDSIVANPRTRNRFNLRIDEKLLRHVNAVIKMVRHEGPCHDLNASPYIVSLKPLFDPIQSLSTKNVTSITKSLLLTTFFYRITTLHGTTCAQTYDGVSEIIFQILEERCTQIPFPILQGKGIFNVPHSVTPKCSSTTVGLSDGTYGRIFTWLEGYQMNIRVSVSHELQHCSAREIYIVIKIHYSVYFEKRIFLQYTYIWKMEQDRFEWTIWDYGDSVLAAFNRSILYSHRTELYIAVKSHSRNNVEQYSNISSCYQTMHIEHQNKKVHGPHPHHFPKRDYEHCLLSTCYFLYPYRTNASWNSAQTLCQKDGRQLLTINSDIKAQFIENILHNYLYLYFTMEPLLFLNMKKDDKVCAIVLCVGYSDVNRLQHCNCNCVLHCDTFPITSALCICFVQVTISTSFFPLFFLEIYTTIKKCCNTLALMDFLPALNLF